MGCPGRHAKDTVQGFQRGVDDASRDVLRNAGVDPAKPAAVRAWLDKDPLNRQKLMQAGVEAMAQNLAIGKAAGQLTGGIGGPKGAAAEKLVNDFGRKALEELKEKSR